MKDSRRVHVLNVVEIILFSCLLLVTSPFAGADSRSDLTFVTRIVGYDQAVEYSVEYGIALSNSTPKILPPLKPQVDRGNSPLAELARQSEKRRERRREAARTLKFSFPEPVKWADVSPNRQYVLVGFEDPKVEVMRRAVVVRTITLERLKEFNFEGRSYIQDSEWSSDSHFLAVLEKSERWSLSPRDLLFALAGHGISLNSFFVNLFEIRPGAASRTVVAKDIRQGTAIILASHTGTQ